MEKFGVGFTLNVKPQATLPSDKQTLLESLEVFAEEFGVTWIKGVVLGGDISLSAEVPQPKPRGTNSAEPFPTIGVVSKVFPSTIGYIRTAGNQKFTEFVESSSNQLHTLITAGDLVVAVYRKGDLHTIHVTDTGAQPITILKEDPPLTIQAPTSTLITSESEPGYTPGYKPTNEPFFNNSAVFTDSKGRVINPTNLRCTSKTTGLALRLAKKQKKAMKKKAFNNSMF